MRIGRAIGGTDRGLRAPVLVTVALVALVSLGGVAQAWGPELFGKIAEDGTLLILGWQDVLGSWQPLEDGDRLREDALLVTVYGPDTNGTVALEFWSYRERRVERTFTDADNTTTVRIVTEKYDEDRWTVWVASPQRETATTLYLLPTSPEPRIVLLTYLDVEYRFVHHTAPVLWPIGLYTRGGQLAFFLSVMILGTAVFGAGAATASLIMRRAKYWPRVGRAGWVLVVGALVFGTYSVLGQAYYEVTAIEWWWWTLPFYAAAVFIMLQVLPPRVERWQLLKFERGAHAEEMASPIREVLVAEDREGHVLVHSTSVRQAILRALGSRTPLTWRDGPPAWYARNTRHEDPVFDVKRLYILDPNTNAEIAFPKLGWKPFLGPAKRPGIVPGKAHIPLSLQHGCAVAGVVAGMTAFSAVARRAEELRLTVAELAARMDAGAIEGDRRELEAVLRQLAVLGPPEPEATKEAATITVPVPAAREKGGANVGP